MVDPGAQYIGLEADAKAAAVERGPLRFQRWLLLDALTHAMNVAARLQDATEGTDATFLFNAARVAIRSFSDDHPAMKALAAAAVSRSTHPDPEPPAFDAPGMPV